MPPDEQHEHARQRRRAARCGRTGAARWVRPGLRLERLDRLRERCRPSAARPVGSGALGRFVGRRDGRTSIGTRVAGTSGCLGLLAALARRELRLHGRELRRDFRRRLARHAVDDPPQLVAATFERVLVFRVHLLPPDLRPGRAAGVGPAAARLIVRAAPSSAASVADAARPRGRRLRSDAVRAPRRHADAAADQEPERQRHEEHQHAVDAGREAHLHAADDGLRDHDRQCRVVDADLERARDRLAAVDPEHPRHQVADREAQHAEDDRDAREPAGVLEQELEVRDDRPRDHDDEDHDRGDAHGPVHAVGEGGLPPAHEHAEGDRAEHDREHLDDLRGLQARATRRRAGSTRSRGS